MGTETIGEGAEPCGASRPQSKPNRTPGRLGSLDAFRGAVIASMILVNNPGSSDHVYAQLAHVEWHGLTFTDVIAPAFLWTIGVTTALSLSRRLQAGFSRSGLFRHVARRAALLYLVGIFLSIFPDFLPIPYFSMLGGVPVMGILQRIAICYLFGSAIFFLGFSIRGHGACATTLLVSYWLLLVWFPGPATGSGPFDPGGNFAHVLDRHVLGRFAETGSHPLLTILTATATVLIGTLVGQRLQAGGSPRDKALWLLTAGIALSVLGVLVGQWTPINRRLWTPSFCLLSAGMATVVFTLFYWAIEVFRMRRGVGWLIAYGVNPIFLFVASEMGRTLANTKGVTDRAGQWHSLWAVGYEGLLHVADPKNASLLYGLAYTILLGVVAVVMFRRGWIVKI